MQSYDYARHARLALRGEDRIRFLHGMVTCDVEKMQPDHGSRTAMLSVKGRLLADLVVYRRPDEILLTMDGDLHDKVQALLDKHIVMDDVEIVSLSHELAEVGVYGDDAALTIEKFTGVAADRLRALAPYAQLQTTDGVLVARDPQLGVPGWRVLSAPGVWPPIGNAMSDLEREVLRVEAGTARYGIDLDEERLIVEANLEDAISFDKGCYLGQEAVFMLEKRGHVSKKLVRLEAEGPLARGMKLLDGETHKPVGEVTSAFGAAGLGVVKYKLAVEGTELQIEAEPPLRARVRAA